MKPEGNILINQDKKRESTKITVKMTQKRRYKIVITMISLPK